MPFEEGRRLAALIPGARFEPLDSRNHLMIESEPAWPRVGGLVRSFLGAVAAAEPTARSDDHSALDGLSDREREILALVAAGRSNLEIADELVISPRTVERHLSNVSTALAWPVFYRLLARSGPTAASTVTLLVPVSATAWGAIVLGEHVGAEMLPGAGLIAASLVLVVGLRAPTPLRLVRRLVPRPAAT